MKLLPALALLAACSESAPANPPAVAESMAVQQPVDSLAGRPVPGVEVWFVDGRPAQDSAGTTCLERGLEIRDSAGRRRVPLLYTLETPARLDDTSLRARIYLHCQPGAAYRVSLRTGLPTPLAQ